MAERCPRAELERAFNRLRNVARTRAVGEALYRDMGVDPRRDFTGTFQNLAARLEQWTPVSDELSNLWLYRARGGQTGDGRRRVVEEAVYSG